MLFDLFAMTILSGEWFYSPFIIPVAGCAMILGIVASGAWARVRTLEIKSHERLARIAQGLPVEPEVDHVATPMAAQPVSGNRAPYGYRQPNDGGAARRGGIVLSSVGIGLIGFFMFLALITHTAGVLIPAAAGFIPLAIGVGFLIDARLKRQEFERYLQTGRLGGWHPGVLGASAPPPPPAGMTPAQASDWRPSSSTLKTYE